MFNKILIANRGEIACRIIRSAHALGVRCVAVYSEADAHAMHVAMADEAYCIGPAPSKDSYLRGDLILDVAKRSGAEAIHPGYGFLSENADFVKACEANEIVFIGPPASAIEAMGSKSAAKTIMEEAGVPLVPGYHGKDQDPALLKKTSDDMGYPVLLKAAAGGGGKGMRIVWNPDEFDHSLVSAKREAMNGFGDDTMLVEKYLTKPRHVEIQVFCDNHGNSVYVFERDCSVQRRHQKVLEEAPAPGMTEDLRRQMGEAAVKAAEAINYVGAGTVEFLLDEDGSFYFMEMNTRLQVEHPVSEMISGQDLVEWQLRVASGNPLPCRQDQLRLKGHAIEARIYAEDPDNDFLPATGQLEYLRTPPENRFVRVDTGVREGDSVSVFYDPMIAKLIVWDENRDRALQRMSQALRNYRVAGLKTNINFLTRVVDSKAFQQAELDTGFIEKHEAQLFPETVETASHLPSSTAFAALYTLLKQQQERAQEGATSNDPNSPWHGFGGWRLNERNAMRIELEYGEHAFEISAEPENGGYILHLGQDKVIAQGQLEGDKLIANLNGHTRTAFIAEKSGHITVFTDEATDEFIWIRPGMQDLAYEDEDGNLTAPMNGSIVAVLTEPGSDVEKGAGLIVMEAMKMEHTITAPAAGKVLEIFFAPGDLVEEGAELIGFEPMEE